MTRPPFALDGDATAAADLQTRVRKSDALTGLESAADLVIQATRIHERVIADPVRFPRRYTTSAGTNSMCSTPSMVLVGSRSESFARSSSIRNRTEAGMFCAG